ncbi:MAG: tetratricopeptide repeat protein [Burkholderiaceae bacterium]|nr:tetratricopeptide repeat protein [Burkholderiaceae bacterium]
MDTPALMPTAPIEPEPPVNPAALPLGDLIARAQALSDGGMAEASAKLYEEWIASTDSPYRHVACFNWGTVLGNLNRHAEAEKAYRHALELNPDFPQARLNLGHQIEHLHRPDEALAEWRQVLDMTAGGGPAMLEFRLHALNNSARLLELLRRLDEAEALMVESLKLKPDQSDVIQHYVHIRQKQCEWPLYQTVGEVTQNQLLLGTSALATLSATDDPALQLLAAQRFVNERITKPATPPLHEVFAARTPRSGKVKIGYLSGDLCMHAVGLLTPELFELHDRSRFEVYGFCWSREDGTAQRQRILGGMDQVFRIGGLDDNSAARLIAQMGVDVLVDLQGLTNGARPVILAHRPAPIQAGYLGLPATSALPGVDWIIADRFVMPPESLRYYTEKPLYVPTCYQVSDRKRDVAPTPTRAQYQLPEDAFVFCSFNNNHKFTEEVFHSWMRIVKAVPNSVLWLLADNPWSQANMLAAAQAHGVAPERLIFAPRVTPAEYLARFQLADLFLDTFPFNAGTTASDVLWMGTPILTRSGRTYISRMAGSLLTHVGLPDLITYSLAEYEQRAVQIGNNPLRATSYKRYLTEQGRNSTLFDIPGLVRDLENEFERMALERRAA